MKKILLFLILGCLFIALGCKEEPRGTPPKSTQQPAEINRHPSLNEVPEDQGGLVTVSEFLDLCVAETGLEWSLAEVAEMSWYDQDDNLLEFEGLKVSVEGVSEEEADLVTDFFADYEASEMNTGDAGAMSAIGYVIGNGVVCHEILGLSNIEMGEEILEDEPIEFNIDLFCGVLPS